MKHCVTGAKAKVFINGKPIAFVDDVAWNQYDMFDSWWNRNRHKNCEQMIERLGMNSNAYAHAYNLCEFLWKLSVLRP
jgi:hypothetical protein